MIQHIHNVVWAIEHSDLSSVVAPVDLDALKLLSARWIPLAISRVTALGEWTGDAPGQGHFVWGGPTEAKTGVPVMYRWDGHKNVPVYKILWPYVRPDALVGRPRKLARCDNRLCASPLCYDVCVPMHVDGRPENTNHKRFRRLNGLARRPVYRGEVEMREGRWTPVCPQCRHPLGFTFAERDKFLRKQIVCRYCEADDDEARISAGLRKPDLAYRWEKQPNPYAMAALVSEAEAQRIEAEMAKHDALMQDQTDADIAWYRAHKSEFVDPDE
jgi:hypothetical protein